MVLGVFLDSEVELWSKVLLCHDNQGGSLFASGGGVSCGERPVCGGRVSVGGGSPL